MTFEYKVVPAPTRGRKVRGVKTPADRFARALEDAINDLAADGWEYQRTDTLPAEQRQGLAGRTTVYQNMLVFRRAAKSEVAADDVVVTAPVPTAEPQAPRPVAPTETIAATPAEMPAEMPPTEPSTARSPSNSLDTMITQELAAARAPRLPSAGAAQELSTKTSSPPLSANRKDLAAE